MVARMQDNMVLTLVPHACMHACVCRENMVARMQDNMVLLKAVPENLMGYVRYARNCLEFQQAKASHAW